MRSTKHQKASARIAERIWKNFVPDDDLECITLFSSMFEKKVCVTMKRIFASTTLSLL